MDCVSKVQKDEAHVLWRIRNFRDAIRPEFIGDSLKLAVVGQSFGLKWKLSCQLTEPLEEPVVLLPVFPPQNLVDEVAVAQRELQQIRQRLQEAEEAQVENRIFLLRIQLRQATLRHMGARGALRRHLRDHAPRQPAPPPQQVDAGSGLFLTCRLEGVGNNELPFSCRRLQIAIKRRIGDDYYFDSDLQPETKNPTGWLIPNMIQTSPPEALNQQLLLVDGALRLQLKLTLSKVLDCDASNNNGIDTAEFETSIVTLVSDVTSATGGYPDDVALTSSSQDGTVCCSSKAVLSGRSPTLAGMFQRNPTEDSFTLDVSPGAFTILFRYLHSGQLPAQGISSYEQILDVAYSANKFGLRELFNYCDEILADYCSMDTASYLLCKSREYRLLKSSQAIMEYITSYSSKVAAEEGGNPPVGSQKEDKIRKMRFNKEAHPGNMDHNYTLKEVVTTGVLKEEYPFTWQIRSFREILTSLHPTPAVFNSTRLTGLFNSQTQWKLSVCGEEKDNRSKISIKLTCARLDNPLVGQLLVPKTRFCIGVQTENKQIQWSPIKPVAESSELELLFKSEEAPLDAESGTLSLKLQVIVFANVAAIQDFQVCNVLRTFGQNATEKLQRDMESLYKSLPAFADVTIVSKEGNQFYAHWRILATRCAAFKSMFESGMKERQSNTINMDDTSFNAVNIMLHFLYTGRIQRSSLASASDIIDVAHVADKYDLSELLRYCDEGLAEKCNLSNASELLAAASLYRLPKAQSAIQSFIRSHAKNTLDFAELVAGLSSPSASSSNR